MDYEKLLNEAYDLGLIVKEKPLLHNDGLIKGNRIAIRKDIDTSIEKSCVLAEELGHYHTSVGNIIDQSNILNQKQERKTRMWAYDKKVGLHGILLAFQHGCRNSYEIAEFLEVTEAFLLDTINAYRERYGSCTTYKGYVIYFIPHLIVGKVKE